MNFLLFFGFFTWHVAMGISSFETQLFSDDAMRLKYAAEEIFKSEVRFSLELYKATTKIEKRYIWLSTIDVYLGLSQLNFGAQNVARQQLSSVLGFSPDCCLAQRGLQDLIYAMNNCENRYLRTRNMIVYPCNWRLEYSFVKESSVVMSSAPKFAENWNEVTAGRMMYDLSKEVAAKYPRYQPVDAEECLVLAGTANYIPNIDFRIYNACEISLPFYHNNEILFHEYPYLQITTDLHYGEFNYYRDSNDGDGTGQFIEIAWTMSEIVEISTIIIIPKERDGISELENHLDEATMNRILSNTMKNYVIANIPKHIVMTCQINLVEALKHMEVTEMFSETSDFAKIMRNYPTKVGAILHQAEITNQWIHYHQLCEPKNVDDDSSFDSSFDSSDEGPIIFNVDHSFIILTVLKGDNPVILSMGRYGWSSNATRVLLETDV